MKVSELNPQNVFGYFSDICSIPHGSGNTGKIADYCVKFAKSHNLEYVKDTVGNVMIFKKASSGYENSEPVILQGHLDMVCEKTDRCTADMANDGIDIQTDGEYVWANETTLGADDGIALAYILAVLDDDSLVHPPIEAFFTVDEETGMTGAKEFDASHLKGKRLINIDSEEEGIFTAGCAGGVRAECTIPVKYEKCIDMNFKRLCIKGLKGGHSGMDIDKRRKNAILILGRILEYVSRKCGIYISDLSGGGKDNAIPRSAYADICFDKNSEHMFNEAVNAFAEILRNEMHISEPDICIEVSDVENSERHMTEADTKKLIFVLMQTPDGIQEMIPELPDMVQTSVNLGILFTNENSVVMKYLIRSNTEAGKQMVIDKINSFIGYIGGKTELKSDYPAWEYRENSPLREIMVKTYEKMYSSSPKIMSIHAGLECGIFSAKLDDADMVSFGPDMENVHTPDERLNVASTERVWNYLVELLANLV
ncbi:MAG: aminoacyl-histidine dipeptidase [Oscillospiraceae bacterium]